jgi:SAM-dependent methyltransferase
MKPFAEMSGSPSSRKPAGDFDYDQAGIGYAAIRKADPRIAAQILAALGDAKTVLNVGAGSGNYEPVDRSVVALEPSAAQRAQRPPDAAPCVIGVAEALPFDDNVFDACMAVATVHQWPDLEKGIAELKRVARRRVVVFTFDPDASHRFWLRDYGAIAQKVETQRMPAIARLADLLGLGSEVQPVKVPFDCTDGFAEAFYGRPEKLLDPAVRAAQSGWFFIGKDKEQEIVDALRRDLDSGEWDRRHGHLRTLAECDLSLRLVIGRK